MMRCRFGWGFLIVVLVITLVSTVADYGRPVWGQANPRGHAGSDVTVVSSSASGGGQWIVLVDNTTRSMGTYLIDGQSGGITLKSVRNCAWDLCLEEFNGNKPAPRDIKAMLENQ